MADDCDNITFYAPTGKLGKEVEEPVCLPETVLPIPDELREPHGAPESEEPELTPRPIRLGNRLTQVFCDKETGSMGTPVTIFDFIYTDEFPFSNVLSITDDVLAYIAKNELEIQIENGIHSGRMDAGQLSKLTGMPIDEAEEFLRLAYIRQAKLDNSAELAAQAQLVCYWINTEQRAECSDPAMAKPEENEKAVFEAVVPAGQYTSYISQEDADRMALEAARAMLNCFYQSDEFVAKCETRPGRPSDDLAPVPNDDAPIYPGLIPRRGTVVVPTGTFTSTYSKEDANSQAEAYGYSLLVCYYPNDTITRECEDPNARNLNIDPETSVPQDADPDKGIRGQRVVVPSGFIISDLSVKEATDEATLLADSLLECCFISAERTVTCAPEEAVTWTGETVTIQPDKEKSPVYSYTLQRGAYTSCDSQEDADRKAEQAMLGMLNCIYCNVRVMPTCVPSWIVDGVNAGEIPLPLLGEVIEWRGHSIYTKDLPPEATIGTEANAYCTNNAQQSQNMGDTAGRIPAEGVTSEPNCTYYSDMVIVGCAVDDPYGNVESGQIGQTPDGEPYYFFSMYPAGSCISKTQSSPEPGKYIVIPAGMYSGQGEDSKEESNSKAIDFAMSILTCVWENPETHGGCGYDDALNSLCDTTWTVGRGLKYDTQITPWSNGPSNPIILAAGMVSYMGGTEIQAWAAIRAQVIHIITSMIVCVYFNDEQIGNCTVGGSAKANPAIVPRGTIIGDTPEQANSMALQLANGLAACYDPQSMTPGPPGSQGPPGPAGPQGRDGPGCSSSSCSGVYS